MIVRYSLVIIESLGRLASSGWLTGAVAPAVTDQLGWHGVNRTGIQYQFDDGGQAAKRVPDNSNVGSDQIAWRKLPRSFEFIAAAEAGRAQPSISPWLTQAPVIDNLAWQKVQRAVTYQFDEGGKNGRWIPDASQLGAHQLTWRGLKRSIDYLQDEGGLKKPNVAPWVAQAPVIDNVAWQHLPRAVEYRFDEGGRSARWTPDASNLSADQIQWRGLRRTVEYAYDEGGLLKNLGWFYPFQPPAAEYMPWRRLQRGVEYQFDEIGRVKSNVAPWVTQAPIIDNLAWQRIARGIEYRFEEGSLAKNASALFTAPVIQPDQLGWRGLRRAIDYTFLEGARCGRWIPDASQLGGHQIPWRKLARFGEWIQDEAGRSKTAGYLFAQQAPAVDNLAWQRLARRVDYAFQEGGLLKSPGYLFFVFIPPAPPLPAPTVNLTGESGASAVVQGQTTTRADLLGRSSGEDDLTGQQ